MSRRSGCRVCGGRRLERIIALGETPLANAFVSAADRGRAQPRYPLDVHLCLGCAHVQLLDVVDPAELFRDYVYVSGTSPAFVSHFRAYANSAIQHAGLRPGDRVVEFGSNDGTLLRCFQDAGMKVLGIDPARAIAGRASASGIETVPEFFTLELAGRLAASGWDGARLVVGNNVFAHADDLHDITAAVARLLAPDGLFFFEVSYLRDVYEKTLFDTIYHEHLSYHTVGPLEVLLGRHGLKLIEALEVPTHGGSLRGVAAHGGGPFQQGRSVEERVEEEGRLRLGELETWRVFGERIQSRKREVGRVLAEKRAAGRRIAGFGAPAKATTLMFHFDLGPETLAYVVDDSPLKQGLFTPGHHIPVLPSSALYEDATAADDVLVLAWNFAEPIMASHRRFLNGGGRSFIVPLPDLAVVGG
jgi:SAM-dependent methyltransferase